MCPHDSVASFVAAKAPVHILGGVEDLLVKEAHPFPGPCRSDPAGGEKIAHVLHAADDRRFRHLGRGGALGHAPEGPRLAELNSERGEVAPRELLRAIPARERGAGDRNVGVGLQGIDGRAYSGFVNHRIGVEHAYVPRARAHGERLPNGDVATNRSAEVAPLRQHAQTSVGGGNLAEGVKRSIG